MAIDRDTDLQTSRPVEVHVQSPARGEHHTSAAAPSRPSAGFSMATVLTSGLLSLLLGGAGAWAYLNYLDPTLKKRVAPNFVGNQEPKPTESFSAQQTAKVDALSGRLDRLQADLEQSRPQNPANDWDGIRRQLSVVDELSRKVEAIEAQLHLVPTKLDEAARKVTSLAVDLKGMQNQVAALRTDARTSKRDENAPAAESKPATEPEGATPREIAPPAADPLAQGVALFQQQKYEEASNFFSSLTTTRPDDARVWYYAALVRGLATRDWKGRAEELVNRGVQREIAGTPSKAQIDAAFANLVAETGKDWLAYFRRKAQ